MRRLYKKVFISLFCICCFIIALFSFITFSYRSVANTTAGGEEIKSKSLNHNSGDFLYRSMLKSMTLEQKSYQVIMTSIDGSAFFPPHLNRHFANAVPGAVLLFKKNIADDPMVMKSYIQDCQRSFQSLKAPSPVLFAIDHEGGAVYRTGKLTTRLPSPAVVAHDLSPEQARRLYSLTAIQLSYLGIHINLAPVAEIRMPYNASFLSDRSFGDDPDISFKYSVAAVEGYLSSGIIPVLKHFPGNTSDDPHLGIPVMDVSKQSLRTDFILPFRKLFELDTPALLASHVLVPVIDQLHPFCLSAYGVRQLLRNELQYDGLVITDDLSMKALESAGFSTAASAVLALEAGCDMIMISDTGFRAAASAIQSKAEQSPEFVLRLDEAVRRIIRIKHRAGLIRILNVNDVFNRDKHAFKSALMDEEAYLAAMRKGAEILGETNEK